jgi:hypothetical protein
MLEMLGWLLPTATYTEHHLCFVVPLMMERYSGFDWTWLFI